jgi:integrase
VLLRIPGKPAVAVVKSQTLLPRYWATVWATGLQGASLSENTLKSRLRHIGIFYDACDFRYGPECLDSAFSEGRTNDVKAMLGDFYLSLSGITSPSSAVVARWDAVRNFVRAIALLLSPWNPAWQAVSDYSESLGEIRAKDVGKFRFVRALPDVVLDELLAISHPESDRNPVQNERVRWRNWLIVHLLLLGGLRRGESLLLVVDSLKHDVDRSTGQLRYWLDVTTTEYEDNRATRPSIKTAESHRQIPVSTELASLYEHYVNEARFAEEDSPYLLTSTRGSALSAESVTKVFEEFTAKLSIDAYERFQSRTGNKRHISPHDLRHTSATARYAMFMDQNSDKGLALQRMRAFFGWSINSEMPELYARSAIQDDLLRAWNDIFDKRVLSLRGRLQ